MILFRVCFCFLLSSFYLSDWHNKRLKQKPLTTLLVSFYVKMNFCFEIWYLKLKIWDQLKWKRNTFYWLCCYFLLQRPVLTSRHITVEEPVLDARLVVEMVDMNHAASGKFRNISSVNLSCEMKCAGHPQELYMMLSLNWTETELLTAARWDIRLCCISNRISLCLF